MWVGRIDRDKCPSHLNLTPTYTPHHSGSQLDHLGHCRRHPHKQGSAACLSRLGRRTLCTQGHWDNRSDHLGRRPCHWRKQVLCEGLSRHHHRRHCTPTRRGNRSHHRRHCPQGQSIEMACHHPVHCCQPQSYIRGLLHQLVHCGHCRRHPNIEAVEADFLRRYHWVNRSLDRLENRSGHHHHCPHRQRTGAGVRRYPAHRRSLDPLNR